MNLSSSTTFLPAKEAAALLSYTPDYVAKLAREHLIVAEQRGRQWFVDPDSLKLFSLKKEAAARERKVQLRAERLEELARAKMYEVEERSRNVVEQGGVVALATTVALSLCIALFGGVMYIANNEGVTSHVLVAGVGGTIERFLEIFRSSEPQRVASEPLVPNEQHAAYPAIILTKTPLPPEMIERISGSFSDPVEVAFFDERTGVITPTFQQTDTPEAYQFILLPDFAITP